MHDGAYHMQLPEVRAQLNEIALRVIHLIQIALEMANFAFEATQGALE
ncbi:MAG: hypothetical protein ACYTDT_11260 [Planctomycetota bacterium]|jgi:hypothetical protein